jgi:tetratricopeptide (TPR) repeat protein
MKMNRKNLLVLMGLSLLIAVNSFASSNERGIDLYRAELYPAAKLFFLQQTNQSEMERAENYYFLGRTYYQLNQIDSAAYFYQRSIEASPQYPFGLVGAGKIELKNGNTRAAEDLFRRANNLARRDPAVQTAIAEVYVELGDINKANEALDRARRINSRFSGIYLVEGDIIMAQGRTGEAATRYENAILFNAEDKVAYLKLARVFKDVNTTLALQYLDRLIALDPEYIPAYALIGDINREAYRYARALEAYEKFISIPGVPLLQHERYAQLLFFTDQFEKAANQIRYVRSRDSDNLVMQRLEAYNSFRLENYSLALEQMNRFLLAMPRERHIVQDYTTLAQIALAEGQPLKAIEAFQNAIEIEPERTDLYKEMATIASGAGMLHEAISFYERFFASESTPEIMDFLLFGRANFRAAAPFVDAGNMAAVTPETRTEYEASFKKFVQNGVNAFGEVIRRRSDLHTGFLETANIYALLDAYDAAQTGRTEGHAKPFYEQALEIMINNNSDGARNRDIITAYRYLISYYAVLDDKDRIIEYSRKILEIDSNDTSARNTLNMLGVRN